MQDNSKKIMDQLNHNMKKIHESEKKAEEIIDKKLHSDSLEILGKAAKRAKGAMEGLANSFTIKDIKKVYGKDWKKSLQCTPLDGEAIKRDKKKAKQARKSRKLNRKKKR